MMEVGVSLKRARVGQTSRILVIEDNRSDVFLLERALKRECLRLEFLHLQSRRDEGLLTDPGVSQFITKPSGLDQFMEIGKVI
jgi:hypothetical protein